MNHQFKEQFRFFLVFLVVQTKPYQFKFGTNSSLKIKKKII